jgi:hypothetical protein
LRKLLLGLSALTLLASGLFATGATVNAADHRDSPSNVADAAADGTDVFAFRSPTNPDNVVLALDFNPLIAPSDNNTRLIDPGVSYAIKVDRTGDAVPDATVTVRYAGNNQFIIEGLGAPITAGITPPGQAPIITKAGPVSVFAGLRDDPFFFDLNGFMAFVAKPTAPAAGLRAAGTGAPSDTFAGTNVDSIVVELPVTALTGGKDANTGTVKLVAQTLRSGKQVDRIAIPAVNTALIPAAKKDAFNAATNEEQDPASFKSDVMASITGLRAAVDPLFGGASTQQGGPLGQLTPEQLTGALLPDVVTVDFSKPLVFPNGRRLQDDVIDTVLGLVLNRGGAAGISDGVSANDKPSLATFPYLPEPWGGASGAATVAAAAPASSTGGAAPAAPPAVAANTAFRPPATGDGGLLHNSSTMWTFSAAFFVLALSFGGVGAFAAMRNRSR